VLVALQIWHKRIQHVLKEAEKLLNYDEKRSGLTKKLF